MAGNNRRRPGAFEATYICTSMTENPGEFNNELNNGGRLILPQSALNELNRRDVQYPMLFKVTNPHTERYTHAGVLEFTADDPLCYMPDWMMRNIGIDARELVIIENVSLRKADFAQFQPQSEAFLEITDPRALLERTLRNFTCLTTGDILGIHYNDHLYELRVLETRPAPAICIIECDLNTDFAPPLGYIPPEEQNRIANEAAEQANATGYVFPGGGHRIDGRAPSGPSSLTSLATQGRTRGVPDFNYVPGTLNFLRDAKFPPKPKQKQEAESTAAAGVTFQAFQGTGQLLRPAATPAKRTRTDNETPEPER